MLVSGDRESEVRYLAEQVGISEVHAQKSPEEKLAIVRAETAKAKTLFVGDGINDAPALMAATVGVAIGQNSDITAEAAGVVIMDSSLEKVDEFMHISRRMRRIAPPERGRRHGVERRRNARRRGRLSDPRGRRHRAGDHRRGGRAQRPAGGVAAEGDSRSLRTTETSMAGGMVSITRNRGRCQECHTPKAETGEFDKSRWMKGGTLVGVPATPIADWHQKSPDLTSTSALWTRWGQDGFSKFPTKIAALMCLPLQR